MATLNLQQALQSGGLKLTSQPQQKIPASSATNKNAANYRVPASSTNQAVNAYGNSVYNNKGAVLGAATVDGSKTGGAVRGSAPAIPTPAPAPVGDQGGNQYNFDADISEMYDPALQATYAAERYANDEYNTDAANLNQQFDTTQGRYEQEGKDLLENTNTEEQKFNKVLESALAEAVRAYNALSQQGAARFGRGNSAGQAVGELAQQEYFRQQGKVNEKQAEGAQQFSQERVKIASYVKQKVDDLDLYKKQAMGELKKNLTDKLLEIQMRRGDIEANKTRDRLAILQDARDKVLAIQEADKQFRQNLALSAISKMQEISGRAFTPAEIQATLAEFQGALSGVNVGASPTAQGTAGLTKRPSTTDDEFGGLVQGGGLVG